MANDIIGKQFDDEALKELQDFGALGWAPQDIATFFGFDIQAFTAEYNNPDSIIAYNIRRGQLINYAEIDKKALLSAKGGNIKSMERIDQIRRERSFSVSKLDIFGAFDDPEKFQRVYDYIVAGKSSDLSNNEKLYLEMLSIVNSIDRQFGKRATIKFLQSTPFNYSYVQAVDYYNEADNLFYANRGQTKEAMRNKLASMIIDLGVGAQKTAQTPKDFEIAGNLYAKAARILALDEPDVQRLPAELYRRQFRVFSLNTETIGLPKIDRHEVGQQIDLMPIPENVKDRLRSESLIEDANIITLLEYGQKSNN